ncbi:alkaline phosphatase family protein [Haloechinothrix salitolerans]|uniref:Alkaline phosphatase family protein n=1 Tax=Haloechinothrix salitolerans TaxID=926830 RepID=A0ABW2C7F8_9PSEU
MDRPAPPDGIPHLAEVTPSLLAAIGTPGFENTLDIANVNSAAVLLIDGLGAELLDTYATDAPTLARLRSGTLQVGYPSTTSAGLAAIGTGTCSGQHGMVGYSFDLPDVGVMNALRWRVHPWGEDLRGTVDPAVLQPMPTAFERATSAGVDVRVVSSAEFTHSGMTQAVLRGGHYIGVHALGDLSASMLAALDQGGFCYGYHAMLDFVGHLYGPGSRAWRIQLRHVDLLVATLVDELPPGAVLAVVADHGMVEIDESVVDADSSEPLRDGVRALGGEARARHVYTVDGAASDVLAAWRDTLGERAWVVSGEEAIDTGWFGSGVTASVRERIGDVVVASRGRSAVLRRTVEPIESSLRGHHGSLTSAEQLVPLVLAYG